MKYNLPSGEIPPNVLAGQVPKYRSVHTIYKAWFTYYFINELNISFWARARGNLDSEGNEWAPLSPKTIAIKKNILKKGLSGFPKNKVNEQRYVGTLSPAQRTRYERSYKRNRKSMTDRKAKEKAWESVQRMGKADPITSLINIRTGNLVRATAPGRVSGNRYYPSPNQIAIFGGVHDISIQIDIEYADDVDQGDPERNVPARPIIPDDVSSWTKLAHSKAFKLAEDEYLRLIKGQLSYAEWRAFLKSRRSDVPF